jgi:hypothetical protein
VVGLVSTTVVVAPVPTWVGVEKAGAAITAVAVSAATATHDPVRVRFRFTGVS